MIAQQSSAPQPAGQQAPTASTDSAKPADKTHCASCEHQDAKTQAAKSEMSCCHGKDSDQSCCHCKDAKAAHSKPCCEGKDAKDMPCCNKDAKDKKSAAHCCCGKDTQMCAKQNAEGCCEDAACKSCCAKSATAANATDANAKNCCAGKNHQCCHSNSQA